MRWRTLALCTLSALHLGAACETKRSVKARPGHVAVEFGWKTDEFPGTMRVYELDERSSLKPWVTGSVKSAAYLPLGRELELGTLFLRPGAVRRLVLVSENRTKEDTTSLPLRTRSYRRSCLSGSSFAASV